MDLKFIPIFNYAEELTFSHYPMHPDVFVATFLFPYMK